MDQAPAKRDFGRPLSVGALGWVLLAVVCLSVQSNTAVAAAQLGEFTAQATWGHRSDAATSFDVRLIAQSPLALRDVSGVQLEPGEGRQADAWHTQAGGGDVDGVAFTFTLPSATRGAVRKEHSIWTHLLKESDPDTARRLQEDPAFRTEPALLTFQMNSEGTRGFTVSVDQLLEHGRLWVPELDVFLSLGESSADFAAHQRALAPRAGQRILDRVRREPEATYAEFTAKWGDMGNPDYQNPRAMPPGHVVGVTWDSAIAKFGIDRWAGVMSDYGNPDRFKLSLELAGAAWKGQRLTDGLPVMLTTMERDGVRYEVEQFAYPLHGPPAERRGDVAMVLFNKITLTELTGTTRGVALPLRHRRDFQTNAPVNAKVVSRGETALVTENSSDRVLFVLQGIHLGAAPRVQSGDADPKRRMTTWTIDLDLALDLAPHGQREFFVKLPSPGVAPADQEPLIQLDYAAAREATLKFWSDYLARGASFVVPDFAVNELFRANLWHALRLPRRHAGEGPDVRIDLPYSNFAYDQTGTPWPVNQAVYVDYMLYDLRGYHDLAREELLAMYRNNQEPNGHVGGYAKWGVYTPGMIYAAAQHYLLSRDRASFAKLLPQTLRAADWCLRELREAAQRPGPAAGLILAPLNDLSHDPKAWAFNEAYYFAALDLLARALTEWEHPRAGECRAAAQALHDAIARSFGRASMNAPLVQLRDHTWSPYVPCDALTPRRLFEIWYPTDVDTGALHLARLKALDPNGALTTALLHDHEDNLFLKGWGMANEPVYNQHATAYLLRDEPEAAIRAFYSMMACAFSHSVFEPVEHRWGWGQYFGPPSTDGAWFELYRRMLIHERDDGSLLLGQAIPRAWLQDGQRVDVQRAPTYFGPLTFGIESRTGSGQITATVKLNGPKRPDSLLIRLRHPDKEKIQRVEVNGQNWKEFDAAKEWIRIPRPSEPSYIIQARYRPPSGKPTAASAPESMSEKWVARATSPPRSATCRFVFSVGKDAFHRVPDLSPARSFDKRRKAGKPARGCVAIFRSSASCPPRGEKWDAVECVLTRLNTYTCRAEWEGMSKGNLGRDWILTRSPFRRASCPTAQASSLCYPQMSFRTRSEKAALGSTGCQPARPKPLRGGEGPPVPSGKLPTGAGRLPAPPILQTDSESSDPVRRLAEEVRDKGWVVYGARSAQADWDLFVCRPDSSQVRNLTRTAEFSEFSPQFSHDGQRLLYRRVPRSETIDNNHHGEQGELVVANNDGSQPRIIGAAGEFPWASWSPDGRQIATLSIEGIFIVDLASRQIARRLDRKGFFQQTTWSPDGRWLCGVANSFGAGWSIARLDLATGDAGAVNRVDCCTPDWFPDSKRVIFSWRPPGQKANRGYGWTQLWLADAEGRTRKLVYGEDGRHVYGGNVSPDGQYVLFAGNLEEDGDPVHAGAPMGLMRVADAPIIGGESRELRVLHPEAKDGPVLTLPVGWEPCWTLADLRAPETNAPPPSATPARDGTHLQKATGVGTVVAQTCSLPYRRFAIGRASRVPRLEVARRPAECNSAIRQIENLRYTFGRLTPSVLIQNRSSTAATPVDDVDRLAAELHDKGWLVFSAKTDRGDWDLFGMRPDGSDRRPLTDTREFNEAGARFAPDGRRLLYYRLPASEPVDNNTYGTFELVIADADGRNLVVFGNGFPWASWGPDGRQIACLKRSGIEIIDLAPRKVVRQLPRKGLVQQLGWSPDGKWFVGTANGLGPFWNIGRLNPETGAINAVSETERYNCTPDWFPDSAQVIYSRGIIPQAGGRAELWMADRDGTQRTVLYAEESRHIYGGCISPDGQYVLFTRSVEDLGKVENSRTTMAIIRLRDTPMIGDDSAALRQRLPAARRGPRLDLGAGWEPHWTVAHRAESGEASRK